MKVFTKFDLAILHDIVFDCRNVSIPDNELIRIYEELPIHIKNQVEEWGIADTVIRESIALHLTNKAQK